MEQRRRRDQKEKTKEELVLSLRRRLNRNLKDRQLLLHKASLLCHFGRTHYYNRLLNDTHIMQHVLKLLPSQNSYPPKSGTEIKYFHSLSIWFKTTIKLVDSRMYPKHPQQKLKRKYLKKNLIEQIERKQACCKQDMIFIYVALLRGMGLQCRLVCNLQPLPMKPAQSDLLPLKLENDNNPPENKKKTSSNNAAKKEKPCGENTKKREKEKVKRGAAGGTADVEEEEHVLSKKPKKEEKLEEKPKKRTTRSKEKEQVEEKLEEEQQEPLKRMTRNKKGGNLKKDQVKEKLEEEQQEPLKRITRNKKGGNLQKDQVTEKLEEEQQQPLKRITRNKKGGNLQKDQVAEKLEAEQEEPLKITTSNKEGENMGKEQVTEKLEAEQEEQLGTPRNRRDGAEAVDIEETGIEKSESENDHAVIKVAPKRTTARRQKILKETQNVPVVMEPTNAEEQPKRALRPLPSRSVSPKFQISPKFMQTETYKQKISPEPKFAHLDAKKRASANPVQIKLNVGEHTGRVLRQRNKNAEPEKLKVPQLDGVDDELEQKERKARGKRPQLKKLNKSRSKEESDDDFQVTPPKKAKAPKAPKAEKKSPRAVLSTDEEYAGEGDTKSPKKNSKATNLWVEAWSDKEECWVCIDIFAVKVHSVEDIRKAASSHMAYVYAFQNDLSIKDVTARYCLHWASVLRKSRVDENWLKTALANTLGKKTKRDLAEDQELRRIHEEKPLPTAISEYKNHPLYALERHLLKFQAIYPADVLPLGFVRKEPVYSRDCVQTLHSREIWHRMARVVKPGEKPYKVVKARPKWDRHTQTVIKDKPLDIFGFWQTKQYEPPVAENGLVPRNEYGNVELFKECMLPKKCVHLRLPGLQRICKKLGIDCANAVVGFDFHQGACHPEYDGFVVCEEFEETVTAAWHDDQRIQKEKEQEKYEARVYGNWKKLIKGVLIRERLNNKYYNK